MCLEWCAGAGTVVATCIEPPPLEPEGCPTVVRRPVFKPGNDIDKIMEYTLPTTTQKLPRLSKEVLKRHGKQFPFAFPVLPDGATQAQRRLLAMLRLRVAMALDTPTALGGIHRPGTVPDVDRFVAAFAGAVLALHADMSPAALTKAIKACTAVPGPRKPKLVRNDHAAHLLLGMSDEVLHRYSVVNNLVVLRGGRYGSISMPVSHLVSITDPNVPVFAMGGARFGGLLSQKNLPVSAPLEEAYLWALACHLALSGSLQFHEGPVFHAKCTDIRAGRIFETTDPTVWEADLVEELVPGVMYYADEEGRVENSPYPSHPRADMWFRSTDDNPTHDIVVLIDITGGGAALVKEKVDKLKATILDMQTTEQARRKTQGKKAVTMHGVIIAPACNTSSRTDKVRVDGHTGSPSTITTACGQDARELLGGLDQLFRYMTPA